MSYNLKYIRVTAFIILLSMAVFSCQTSTLKNDDDMPVEALPDISPMSASELYFSAVELVKQKEYITARDHLLKARELKPENASYALYLGWLYVQYLGAPELAVIELEEAERLNPDIKMLHANLARAYREVAYWDKAGPAFLKAGLESDPPNALHMFEAGRMFFYAGRHTRGIALMHDAYNLENATHKDYMEATYSELLYQLGRTHLLNNQLSEAFQVFSKLEDFIEQIEYNDTFMLRHFTAYFYTISYTDIIEQLSTLSVADNAVHVPILSVLPESLKNNTEELEKIYDARKLAQKLILVLSKGHVVLDYEDIFVARENWKLATFISSTRSESWGDIDVVDAKESAVTLIPYLAGSGIRLSDYDTIFIYFDPSGLQAPRPSASVLYKRDFRNYFDDRERMGFISFPLISYHASEGVYVHEYFHLLENLYGISPKHGFSPDRHYTENKRAAFPDWNGSGQFPYYQYHFINTIAPAGYDQALHP